MIPTSPPELSAIRLAPLDGGRPDLLCRATRVGGKFQNPIPTAIGGFRIALRALPRYLSSTAERVPKTPLGPFHTDPVIFAAPPASGLRITWMGHSTLLLEIDGIRVLLDPVWEQRASPFRRLGPRRFFAPPLPLDQLPPIDVILVSHNHYDHLGKHTLRQLARLPQARTARWVTSLGVGALLRKCGVGPDRLHELDWTDGIRIAPPSLAQNSADRWIEIRAWPARHFSGRGVHDRFRTLWSSFSLRGPAHNVFFGGDSGPWEGFAPIAQAAGPFDLTLLEIGAFDELWADIHLGPDAAASAFAQMQAVSGSDGLFMPIHWGLFDLALHAWNQPIERLIELSQANGIPLWTPTPGQPTDCYKAQPYGSAWWRAGRP